MRKSDQTSSCSSTGLGCSRFEDFKPEGTYNARGQIRRFLSLFSVASVGFASPLRGFECLSLFAEIRYSLLSIAGFAVSFEVLANSMFELGIIPSLSFELNDSRGDLVVALLYSIILAKK